MLECQIVLSRCEVSSASKPKSSNRNRWSLLPFITSVYSELLDKTGAVLAQSKIKLERLCQDLLGTKKENRYMNLKASADKYKMDVAYIRRIPQCVANVILHVDVMLKNMLVSSVVAMVGKESCIELGEYGRADETPLEIRRCDTSTWQSAAEDSVRCFQQN